MDIGKFHSFEFTPHPVHAGVTIDSLALVSFACPLDKLRSGQRVKERAYNVVPVSSLIGQADGPD